MPLTGFQFIDLTHPITPQVPVFPGDPPASFTPHSTLTDDGFQVTSMALGSHLGTHVDAPNHFLPNAPGVDQLNLADLCGPAAVFNLKSKGNPGSVIEIDDFKAHEDLFVPGARVIIDTGWSRYYGTNTYFRATPVISVEACKWLAGRSIGLLGLDLPTLHTTAVAETHIPLLEAGTIIVESLNLRDLTGQASLHFFAAPLPLVGIDGSPIRAFALVPPGNDAAGPPQRSDIRIIVVQTAGELLEAFHIRETVFIREQGVDPALERDEADRDALHLLAYAGPMPVGTLRIVRKGTQGKIGRFAVLKPYRGQGIGRALLDWTIRFAPTLGLCQLHLHAQTHAAAFYEKAGFVRTGPEFMEAGIPHVPMTMSVSDENNAK